MGWPVYFKDRLIIGNLESNVGIATLWMPKEIVALEVGEKLFSVCGQLYTKRGINPLLRNIFANPRIRYLVLCGVDRQGSGDALLKFFKNGIEEKKDIGERIEGWRVKDDDELLIDSEIPYDRLELLRKNVEIIDQRLKPGLHILEYVKKLRKMPAFAKPEIFPDIPAPKISAYPTDFSVFKVRRDFIGDAWLDVLKTVNRFGVEVEGLYGKVKEVHNLSVVVDKEDPDKVVLQDFLKFRRDGLEKYLKGFFDIDKGTEAYTYGERLYNWDGINQVDIMIKKLRGFPYDRGALCVLWKPHKDNFPPERGGWQVPCLVMILGQCIGDAFHMTAVFRNNDVYGAWPLNAFALRTLQKRIAFEIGKNMGSLTTTSHIAEVYEIDWEDSLHIVEQNDSTARTCVFDSRGYYTVNVTGGDIVVTFFNPAGSSQLAEFRRNGKEPKAARDLCALILKDMLVSELGAAADLGRQLAKAEAAVKLGLKFEQDKELRRI